MDLMNDMMTALTRETTPAVQAWMNWMMATFLLSIVFMWTKRAALYTFIVFWLNLALVLVIYHLTQNVHLFGISHIILWLPLAIYLLKSEIQSETFNIRSFYGIWLVILVATIAISLVFDFRDLISMAIGINLKFGI